MVYSPRDLIKSPPSEAIVSRVRGNAVWVEGQRHAAHIQTGLTQAQVEAALAFYILDDVSWQSIFTDQVTADARRIWRYAEPGSQILLNSGMNRLVVRDATWLQRLVKGLPVEPLASAVHDGDFAPRPEWHSQNPMEIRNRAMQYGFLSGLPHKVQMEGRDTPNNIGLFIPASLKDGVVGSR